MLWCDTWFSSRGSQLSISVKKFNFYCIFTWQFSKMKLVSANPTNSNFRHRKSQFPSYLCLCLTFMRIRTFNDLLCLSTFISHVFHLLNTFAIIYNPWITIYLKPLHYWPASQRIATEWEYRGTYFCSDLMKNGIQFLSDAILVIWNTSIHIKNLRLSSISWNTLLLNWVSDGVIAR